MEKIRAEIKTIFFFSPTPGVAPSSHVGPGVSALGKSLVQLEEIRGPPRSMLAAVGQRRILGAGASPAPRLLPLPLLGGV